MKKSRFSDSQILSVLKQAEGGIPVPQLCREHNISSATFYKWRSKYGGMDVPLMARMRELEEENRRLKKMYAEERLKAEIIQEALEGKLSGHLSNGRWPGRRSINVKSASGWPARPSASAQPATATGLSSQAKTIKSPIGCCV